MAKSIIGQVSSISGNKTIVITTHWRKTHPIYKKQYKVSAKYMAHDEKNETRVGDKVVIEESRPISARKRYTLKEILQRAELTQEDRAIFEKEAVPEAVKPADKTVNSAAEAKKPTTKAKSSAKSAKAAADKEAEK